MDSAKNVKERRETLSGRRTAPTQAKTGLEWATDPGVDCTIVRNLGVSGATERPRACPEPGGNAPVARSILVVCEAVSRISTGGRTY